MANICPFSRNHSVIFEVNGSQFIRSSYGFAFILFDFIRCENGNESIVDLQSMAMTNLGE